MEEWQGLGLNQLKEMLFKGKSKKLDRKKKSWLSVMR